MNLEHVVGVHRKAGRVMVIVPGGNVVAVADDDPQKLAESLFESPVRAKGRYDDEDFWLSPRAILGVSPAGDDENTRPPKDCDHSVVQLDVMLVELMEPYDAIVGQLTVREQ